MYIHRYYTIFIGKIFGCYGYLYGCWNESKVGQNSLQVPIRQSESLTVDGLFQYTYA